MSRLAPDWPLKDDDVREALLSCYADGSWGRYHGPHCRELGEALCRRHGVEHAVLCSSGTIAVELALRGVGVSSGDEVLLAGYDFPGNFRAIEAIGARPALVDIAPMRWHLNADLLADAIRPETRAIVVSHLHGSMAPMERIVALVREQGLAVVEDACQTPGAEVSGRPAGAWGDAGVMSFGGSKLLTAGRGGAILTSHADVRQRIKAFAERGNDAFPFSELQAAVLLPQLQKLDERNQRRAAAIDRLTQSLADVSQLRSTGVSGEGNRPAYYKLAWLLDERLSRDRFIADAQAAGAAIDAGFRGFTLRSARRCRATGPLDQSDRAAKQTVILHHPVLLESPDVIDELAAVLRSAIEKQPSP